MLALLLAQALPGALPRQALPAAGCAAFLWSAGADRRLVAVAGAAAGTLRVSLDGKPVDLARVGPAGPDAFGLGGAAEYRAGTDAARLDLEVATRADLTGGGLVPAGTLTLERAGADAVVLPVAGLIGCAAAPR